MHTIGVDKITLFKTTKNNVFSPTCFDPHWIIIREVYTLLANDDDPVRIETCRREYVVLSGFK
jgi:hypothetical protein